MLAQLRAQQEQQGAAPNKGGVRLGRRLSAVGASWGVGPLDSGTWLEHALRAGRLKLPLEVAPCGLLARTSARASVCRSVASGETGLATRIGSRDSLCRHLCVKYTSASARDSRGAYWLLPHACPGPVRAVAAEWCLLIQMQLATASQNSVAPIHSVLSKR